MSDILEADRIEGLPHPRETYELLGHDQAEQEFLASMKSGKQAHAWLISGAPGIGKATLAYRIARFMLGQGDGLFEPDYSSLTMSSDDHVSHLIESQSHSNLLVLKRPWDEKAKKLKTAITVDEVRRLSPFFGMSAGQSGWRVCIIDTADELNVAAANALLKNLEEPPQQTLLLLLANAPGRLLPTIRSRCRHLRLNPLEDEHVDQILDAHFREDFDAAERAAIARLAEGSAGRALTLAQEGGLELYQDIIDMLGSLPNLDTLRVLDFCRKMAPANQAKMHALTFDLISDFLQRLVRFGAYPGQSRQNVVPGETELMQTLLRFQQPPYWVTVWDTLQELQLRSQGLHLDAKQTMMQAIKEFEVAYAA